ncbi:protein translocase subunit SecF, partial [Vibrio diabolicus]|nr:protein translocase subunit SecF [Vibrio diabolicus]
MVEMLKQNIRKIRHFTTLVSIVLTVIALGALGFKGLNLGLDFTGGMVTEVKVDKSLTNHDLLDALQPKLGESTSVTRTGEDGRWLIRYSAPEEG